MADTDTDGLDEAFEGFGEDPAPVTPPATPPADPPKEDPTKVEEPKKDEEPAKTPEETPPAPADDKKTEEGAEPPKAPETPPAPADATKPGEEPAPAEEKPLTKGDVQEVVSNLLNTERTSSKELDSTTTEVLEKFYPDGLSNVLVDESTGKELRTPQDVVDASGGEMSTEQAAQWLLNAQHKLDTEVAEIKTQARQIAETTVNFKRDAVAAVQKYAPLFEKYPALQQKVFDKLMKQVKVDEAKGVILSAPDVIEHYDDYLEPYQQAYEFSTKQPATNPTPDPNEPPKPTAEDRMDEGGDAGTTAPDDPNDFAQQVGKELAREI